MQLIRVAYMHRAQLQTQTVPADLFDGDPMRPCSTRAARGNLHCNDQDGQLHMQLTHEDQAEHHPLQGIDSDEDEAAQITQQQPLRAIATQQNPPALLARQTACESFPSC